jgi:capsular exopolysaccharide synthesis family protein
MEQFNRLKINILSRTAESDSRAILMTSSLHSEGTSTIAYHLSTAFTADTKTKVLLVDGNLRRPRIGKIFKLENKPGLSDLIKGDADAKDCIHKTKHPNLCVITSGKECARPSEIFESDEMQAVFNSYRDQYDYIIFDSAPVNVYPDTLILSPLVDGIVLIVKAEHTRREIVKHAKEQLEKNKGNLLGVVINRRKFALPEFIYKRL